MSSSPTYPYLFPSFVQFKLGDERIVAGLHLCYMTTPAIYSKVRYSGMRPYSSSITLMVFVMATVLSLLMPRAIWGQQEVECQWVTLSQELPLLTAGVAAPGDAALASHGLTDRIVNIDDGGRVRTWLEPITAKRARDLGLGPIEWNPYRIRATCDRDFVLLFQQPPTTEEQPAFRILPIEEENGVLSYFQPLIIPEYFSYVVTDFEPLTKTELLLFGKFDIDGTQATPAFVYANFETNKSYVYRELPFKENRDEYYYYLYSGMPFMTSLNLPSIGPRAFSLFFRKTGATIGTFDARTKLTMEFDVPSSYQDVPQFSEIYEDFFSLRGREQAIRILQLVEVSRMAVSVFSWEGRLALLVKEAMNASGHTSWSVIFLDPLSGEPVGVPVPLPTTAAHVTVIPGENNWKIVERDPVQAVGSIGIPYLRTGSMTIAPAKWFREPEATLLLAVRKGVKPHQLCQPN